MIDIDKTAANQYSPLALAFLGDAVYSELVREMILRRANMPARKLHKLSVGKVCAAYQARAYLLIKEILTDEESDILRRGRNSGGNEHHIPKNSDHTEYSRATALETLFGWLKLIGDDDRINELFNYIIERNTDEK